MNSRETPEGIDAANQRRRDSLGMQPHDPEEFDSAVSPAVPSSALRAIIARGGNIFRVVMSFSLGQGALQAVGVLGGLFLVRSLSVERYAQFGIATGFQSVFTILMDLGFAGTIIPMVGERNRDKPLIGRYVRAARHLRDRTFLFLAPIACVAFLATVHKRHWSWPLQIGLLASVLLSLYSGGVVSFFSAPLFLFGKLRAYYVPQVISGTARVLAFVVFFLAGGLTAWTAAGLTALTITLNGVLIRRSAHHYMEWPKHDDAAAERELLRYVLPATPAIVFSAFQSQISLFLISIFGSTLYIAEISALSRIGQLFAVLMTFNTIVVEPYVARLSRARLARRYVGLIALASLAMMPVVLVAFRWPGVFLAILGPKFQGLRAPMGWYVLGACMNFVSGLVWIMNRARKWVFWDGSAVEVVLLLVVQILFLTFLGVRNTQQAVFFTLASSACYMVAHGYVAVRGFLKPAS